MKTGRWRVKLDVPEADLTEMLPATRILSQSKDPEVAYRSKEFFMAAVSRCGFVAESLTEQLQVRTGSVQVLSLGRQHDYCTVSHMFLASFFVSVFLLFPTLLDSWYNLWSSS